MRIKLSWLITPNCTVIYTSPLPLSSHLQLRGVRGGRSWKAVFGIRLNLYINNKAAGFFPRLYNYNTLFRNLTLPNLYSELKIITNANLLQKSYPVVKSEANKKSKAHQGRFASKNQNVKTENFQQMTYKLKPYLLNAGKRVLLEIRGTASYEDLPTTNFRQVKNQRKQARRMRQLERKKVRRLMKPSKTLQLY